MVNYSAEQVLAIIYNMDYDYDDVVVTENLKATMAQIGPKEVISTATPNVFVSEQTQSIGTIDNNQDYNGVKVLLDIFTTFDDQPNGLYEIYLNHPEGQEFEVESPTFIGAISFFGANHGDPRNTECLKGCCSPVSEDGKLMTVFTFELNSMDTYNLTIHRSGSHEDFGLKVNKLTLRDYNL